MNFEDAVRCLKEGKRIMRATWSSAYLKIENQKVKMGMGFRPTWHYKFRDNDLFANDWRAESQ